MNNVSRLTLHGIAMSARWKFLESFNFAFNDFHGFKLISYYYSLCMIIFKS